MFKHMFFCACLSITLLLVGCKCPFCHGKQEQVTQEETEKTITSLADFKKEVLNAKTGVVVDFFAPWCGPCRASKPIFEAVAKQLAGKYKFIVVNVDAAEEIARDNRIQGIPAFLFFEGGKEISRSVGGLSSKEEFIKKIEKEFTKKS